jgi:hypothetical protein
MPYPESCPECGGTFRNTGTHFTARRNEVGRHVLLELGCQTTSRRFWWDFTSGAAASDGRPSRAAPERREVREAVGAGMFATGTNGTNGTNGALHNGTATNGPLVEPILVHDQEAITVAVEPILPLDLPTPLDHTVAPPTPPAAPALKDAFVRQLQLDRMTLRQMRSLLMSDEARRAIEVAVGATEATYERLALILFGNDLTQLLGKQAPQPAAPTMSAEERLELQREKARIRARLRRAAIKAAKSA